MDSLPIEVFNKLVTYYLNRQNFRDAMLIILQANYRLKFSEIVRLRFCHIINDDNTVKETLQIPAHLIDKHITNPYNNIATSKIIELYLKCNSVKPYEYLFYKW